MKTCNCCNKEYSEMPKDAKENEDGFWFNCECKSTLFWPKIDLSKKEYLQEKILWEIEVNRIVTYED